tara:strand:+ start:653 stop:1930 length:1278 start_codon:yes stop_codon:yes gene_type:complete
MIEMKSKITVILLCLVLFSTKAYSQKPILFIGGTAHLGNGKVIKNSAVSINNGKFDIVADASLIRIDPSAFDTIHRIYDKHIYPAFIVPNTTLGITEISAVRATNDYNETGNINPNVRSQIAYNTDSKISKTIRSNGVLIAQVTPRGGRISGQSSIMYLDGWNWQDATLKADDGIHVNWPESYYETGWWANPGGIKENKNYSKQIDELTQLFNKAKAYSNGSNIIDLKMESMKGLFEGNKTLYVHCNYSGDMRDAIEFINNFNIEKKVIIGGEDALKIKDLIKKNNIPIILNRVHRLPDSQDNAIDAPFTQAYKLQKEGILFCLSYSGSMEAMGARNLPFTAGTTVAYGQEYEDAVKSITLNPAKILGIDDILGSVEKGKEATFFISTGDALDMKTNSVESAYIKGKPINLNNHQKDLFRMYNNR